VRQLVQNVARRLGYKISRISSQANSPKHGFVDGVFGHKLYQNVADVAIDFTGLSGYDVKDIGGRLKDGELELLVREIRPGTTVVDIGANVGFMTTLMAKLVGPSGKVIAFEPGPMSFTLLQANTMINGYKNVVLEKKAVSSKTGMETLYICPTGESDNQVSAAGDMTFKDEVREAVPIETVRLDDYFPGDAKIDFLKMDIQGGEYVALQGMQDLLRRNGGIRVMVEFAPYMPLWNGVSPQKFLDLIRSMGFEIHDLADHTPKPVTDGALLETYAGAARRMTNLFLRRP